METRAIADEAMLQASGDEGGRAGGDQGKWKVSTEGVDRAAISGRQVNRTEEEAHHNDSAALTGVHSTSGRFVPRGRQKPWGTPMKWLDQLRALHRRDRIVKVQR